MTEDGRRPAVYSLFLRCVGAFLLLNVLLVYMPVTGLSLVVLALLGAVCLLVDYRKLLALGVSLLVTTVILEVIVRTASVQALNPFYRPHEMLALETSYKPNQSVEMTVPNGDLLAIDTTLPRSLGQARHEIFKTDSLGYRNDDDYRGEKTILVGDSFLVGTETTLASLLRKSYGVPVYNVSFSGMGPLIYAEKIDWARRNLCQTCCFVQFLFEGNDFQPVDSSELAVRDAVPRGVQKIAKSYVRLVRGQSAFAKSFYGLSTRAAEVIASRWRPNAESGEAEVKTLVRDVGGKPMVFLRGYADVVRRPSFDDHGFVRSRLASSRPDAVVFIPDKFRVYGPLLDQDPVRDLPNSQWEYVKKSSDELGITAVELTPHLLDRSRELLKTGAVTFWRDDTHWNANGEAVAADVLLSVLRSAKGAACSVARP